MWVYIDSLVHPNRQNNITVSALNLSVGKLGNKVITGVATNITDRTLSYAQIEFNIYDKYNTQVGSTMTNINNFEPHSKWEFEAPVIEETASTTKLKKITSY
jgi:hypothetical protein